MSKTRTAAKRKRRGKAGRPRGSKDGPVAQATVLPSRCPKCGSTKRQDYANKVVQEYSGLDPDGKPYTRIIRRRTKCLSCGQVRMDRTFEFAPKE